MIHLYQLPQIPYIVKKDSISNVKETIPAEYQKKQDASKLNNDKEYITCYLVLDTDVPPVIEENIFDNNIEIDENYNGSMCYFAETMPEFSGGRDSLYAFLTKHLIYPEQPKKAGIQGVLLIEFVVEKDGSVSNTKVLSSLHPDCDNEAMRVIKMLKFTPALVNKQPARVSYMVPVQFRLE